MTVKGSGRLAVEGGWEEVVELEIHGTGEEERKVNRSEGEVKGEGFEEERSRMGSGIGGGGGGAKGLKDMRRRRGGG